MGALYAPTFWQTIAFFIPGLIAVVLIPVVWVIYILAFLILWLFNPAGLKRMREKTSEWIFLATFVPIAATFIHIFVIIWTILMLLLEAIRMAVTLPFQIYVWRKRSLKRWMSKSGNGLLSSIDSGEKVEKPSRPSVAGELNTTKAYQYTSLRGSDEFRLLGISPGKFNDPLRGKVISTRISGFRPAYEALSYTWADEIGNGERTKRFLCGKKGVIMITTSCDAAMRRLRLPDKMRWMWIDAICIDQSSDAERSYQVSMMHKIYTSAKGVVVYTGEETAGVITLFDWVNGLDTRELRIPSRWDVDNAMGSVATGIWIYWNAAKDKLLSLTRARNKRKINVSEQELIQLATEYFSRRWFTRVWVLQEVTLPDIRHTTIICGSLSTPAIRALHLLTLLKDASPSSPSINLIRIFVLLRHPINQGTSHLLDLLIETRARQCSDPRDKIFGILSIAKYLDGNRFPELEADYGMSVVEVYTYYSSFFVRHHGLGFFLSLVRRKSGMEGLPFWAVDWTLPWGNDAILKGRDFPAAERGVNGDCRGEDVEFDAHIIAFTRPRILKGYFTRTGYVDDEDENEVFVEDVEQLWDGEVLVQVYPGLALLLVREEAYFVFERVCPFALTVEGLEDVVRRWGSVVLDGRGWQGGERSYLGVEERFEIK
ncbi:hypothetical protein HYALB_00011602 [Hymenoscyphus albidus]|uniref:Heterokaryon incompatibility domain-containing protein n=1 Tax=Hymenoscyphus albidus TaxID=595503 RepID=A0A9N9LT22_9HELO|nr:hypothetical protein HYALB_00011602 [Hymenoscyphus albidus]